jgi:hypothetical protein
MVTTQCPVFGRGYFLGFVEKKQVLFQSCFDHRVLIYKIRSNAEKRVAQILWIIGPPREGETFAIEEVPNT